MTIELPQTVRYVLDTDSVTYQQLGRNAIVQRLAQVPATEVATTIVTMYEQLRGQLAAINRNQSDQELQLAFNFPLTTFIETLPDPPPSPQTVGTGTAARTCTAPMLRQSCRCATAG